MLLYVDESGNASDTRAAFVLGAVAIAESSADWVRSQVEEVMANHLGDNGQQLEFHAAKVRGGSGPWFGISQSIRESLMFELCDVLVDASESGNEAVSLFAIVYSPSDNARFDPVERCFEELFLRFRRLLVRRVADARQEYGIVIADESKYEAILQPITAQWREVGTRFGPLRRLVEVPLFTDSRSTSLLQLADLVAYAAYRFYVAQDHALLEGLLPAFRTELGVVHGLLHLTKKPSECPCPGCASHQRLRRLRQRRKAGDSSAADELRALQDETGIPANPLTELELSNECFGA